VLNNSVKFYKSANSILEGYGSILTKSRIFYPRNFALSNEFIGAFKKEVKRLKAENVPEKEIIRKITKALYFHAKD
jgi:hypothetical protein